MLENKSRLLMLIPGDVISSRGFKFVVTEVKGSGGVFDGRGVVQVPFFNMANVRVAFAGVQLNNSRELVAGEIVTLYNPGSEIAQVIEDAHKIGEDKPKSEEQKTDSLPVVSNPDYVVEGTVDTIYINSDGKIIVVDNEGKQTVLEQKKDEKTGEVKETVIGDAGGNTYTVGRDGEVTKSPGANGNSNTNTIVQADPIKDRIIVLILEQFEKEIEAWLRINGKGGEDDPDVILASALPSCFEQDAKFLTYIKENTIPYFKDHPVELREKIESNQTNKIIFDNASGQFKSANAVDFSKLNEPDREALINGACEAVNESTLVVIDRLISCLAGATIDVGLQYTFKWVELWMDDTPVSFTDYEAGFGSMDASQVAVSASIACAAAMIPIIPSSKNKLIVAVVAGLGDGAYAMADNIYKQYDELEEKYPHASVGELIGKINWTEAVQQGGVNFVITGISTGVVLYAKGNPKFVNFAKQLEDKIKRQGTLFLERAGLNKQGINLLLEKLGIKIFKAVDFSKLDIPGAMNHVKFRDLKTPRNKGIGGCHDAVEWAKIRQVTSNNYTVLVGKTLDEVPEAIIFNVTKHTKVPGISVVEYKIPALDPKLKTSGALVSVDPKTIYDPSIWTDARLEQALMEAVQDAVNKNNGIIKEGLFDGITKEGYSIRGFIRSGKIDTFYFL